MTFRGSWLPPGPPRCLKAPVRRPLPGPGRLRPCALRDEFPSIGGRQSGPSGRRRAARRSASRPPRTPPGRYRRAAQKRLRPSGLRVKGLHVRLLLLGPHPVVASGLALSLPRPQRPNEPVETAQAGLQQSVALLGREPIEKGLAHERPPLDPLLLRAPLGRGHRADCRGPFEAKSPAQRDGRRDRGESFLFLPGRFTLEPDLGIGPRARAAPLGPDALYLEGRHEDRSKPPRRRLGQPPDRHRGRFQTDPQPR